MKPDIQIDIETDNAIPQPEDFRYMYVLFTLEHRAYSIGETLELVEKMKAEGATDIHVIKIDCGTMEPVPLDFELLEANRLKFWEGGSRE